MEISGQLFVPAAVHRGKKSACYPPDRRLAGSQSRSIGDGIDIDGLLMSIALVGDWHQFFLGEPEACNIHRYKCALKRHPRWLHLLATYKIRSNDRLHVE
jgi:hypothetical protein